MDGKFNQSKGLCKLRDIPFELRVVVCFRHLRLGGALGQHQASYSLDYSSSRNFFLEKFLMWMWELKDEYIYLPWTKEEINHVERLFRTCGHPCAIGSIDCIRVGWHTCRYTLKVKCTNTGAGDAKGNPSIVFQVVASHTTKLLSISRMFWGATTDSILYKFDVAVHELMTGQYVT
jgi:hypothetical protein